MSRCHRRTLVVCAALLALLSVSEAWGQEERRRGRGRGRWNAPRIDKTRLLGSEQVRTELGLNEEQTTKVTELLAEHSEKAREARPPRGQRSRDSDLTDEEAEKRRQEFQAKRKALQAEFNTSIASVLEPKQAERLDQIVLQVTGPLGLTAPNVVAALGLSEEQIEGIKGAVKKQGETLRELFSGDRSGDRSERRKRWEGVQKETDAAVLALLTETQQATLTTLKGEPFELDRRSLFRRGGRGGRGRGGERGGPRKRPPVDDDEGKV